MAQFASVGMDREERQSLPQSEQRLLAQPETGTSPILVEDHSHSGGIRADTSPSVASGNENSRSLATSPSASLLSASLPVIQNPYSNDNQHASHKIASSMLLQPTQIPREVGDLSSMARSSMLRAKRERVATFSGSVSQLPGFRMFDDAKSGRFDQLKAMKVCANEYSRYVESQAKSSVVDSFKHGISAIQHTNIKSGINIHSGHNHNRVVNAASKLLPRVDNIPKDVIPNDVNVQTDNHYHNDVHHHHNDVNINNQTELQPPENENPEVTDDDGPPRGGISVNGRCYVLCATVGKGGSAEVFRVQAYPTEAEEREAMSEAMNQNYSNISSDVDRLDSDSDWNANSNGAEVQQNGAAIDNLTDNVDGAIANENNHSNNPSRGAIPGEMYALKIVFARSQEEFDQFFNEVELLNRCQGQGNVIQILDFETNPQCFGIFMVMELASEGDLFHYLKDHAESLRLCGDPYRVIEESHAVSTVDIVVTPPQDGTAVEVALSPCQQDETRVSRREPVGADMTGADKSDEKTAEIMISGSSVVETRTNTTDVFETPANDVNSKMIIESSRLTQSVQFLPPSKSHLGPKSDQNDKGDQASIVPSRNRWGVGKQSAISKQSAICSTSAGKNQSSSPSGVSSSDSAAVSFRKEKISLEEFDTRCQSVLSLFTQALNGVRSLHLKNIIHSDLKPANFLVCGEDFALFDGKPAPKAFGLEAGPNAHVIRCAVVKVADLGLAAIVREGESHVTRGNLIGTQQFMAPEAIFRMNEGIEIGEVEGDEEKDDETESPELFGKVGEILRDEMLKHAAMKEEEPRFDKTKIRYASDVWSMGVILFLMMYQRTPYAHLRRLGHCLWMVMLDESVAIQFQPGMLGNHSQEFERLVQICQGCLQHKPSERWNLERIFEEINRDLTKKPYDLKLSPTLQVRGAGTLVELKTLTQGKSNLLGNQTVATMGHNDTQSTSGNASPPGASATLASSASRLTSGQNQHTKTRYSARCVTISLILGSICMIGLVFGSVYGVAPLFRSNGKPGLRGAEEKPVDGPSEPQGNTFLKGETPLDNENPFDGIPDSAPTNANPRHKSGLLSTSPDAQGDTIVGGMSFLKPAADISNVNEWSNRKTKIITAITGAIGLIAAAVHGLWTIFRSKKEERPTLTGTVLGPVSAANSSRPGEGSAGTPFSPDSFVANVDDSPGVNSLVNSTPLKDSPVNEPHPRVLEPPLFSQQLRYQLRDLTNIGPLREVNLIGESRIPMKLGEVFSPENQKDLTKLTQNLIQYFEDNKTTGDLRLAKILLRVSSEPATNQADVKEFVKLLNQGVSTFDSLHDPRMAEKSRNLAVLDYGGRLNMRRHLIDAKIQTGQLNLLAASIGGTETGFHLALFSRGISFSHPLSELLQVSVTNAVEDRSGWMTPNPDSLHNTDDGLEWRIRPSLWRSTHARTLYAQQLFFEAVAGHSRDAMWEAVSFGALPLGQSILVSLFDGPGKSNEYRRETTIMYLNPLEVAPVSYLYRDLSTQWFTWCAFRMQLLLNQPTLFNTAEDMQRDFAINFPLYLFTAREQIMQGGSFDSDIKSKQNSVRFDTMTPGKSFGAAAGFQSEWHRRLSTFSTHSKYDGSSALVLSTRFDLMSEFVAMFLYAGAQVRKCGDLSDWHQQAPEGSSARVMLDAARELLEQTTAAAESEVKHLLQKGGSAIISIICARDENGETAYDLAKKSGKQELIDILKDAALKTLRHGIKESDPVAVRCALEQGGHEAIHGQDADHLARAIQSGHEGIVSMLLNAGAKLLPEADMRDFESAPMAVKNVLKQTRNLFDLAKSAQGDLADDVKRKALLMADAFERKAQIGARNELGQTLFDIVRASETTGSAEQYSPSTAGEFSRSNEEDVENEVFNLLDKGNFWNVPTSNRYGKIKRSEMSIGNRSFVSGMVKSLVQLESSDTEREGFPSFKLSTRQVLEILAGGALLDSVKAGDLFVAGRLIDLGANCWIQDFNGDVPLTIALIKHHRKFVQEYQNAWRVPRGVFVDEILARIIALQGFFIRTNEVKTQTATKSEVEHLETNTDNQETNDDQPRPNDDQPPTNSDQVYDYRQRIRDALQGFFIRTNEVKTQTATKSEVEQLETNTDNQETNDDQPRTNDDQPRTNGDQNNDCSQTLQIHNDDYNNWGAQQLKGIIEDFSKTRSNLWPQDHNFKDYGHPKHWEWDKEFYTHPESRYSNAELKKERLLMQQDGTHDQDVAFYVNFRTMVPKLEAFKAEGHQECTLEKLIRKWTKTRTQFLTRFVGIDGVRIIDRVRKAAGDSNQRRILEPLIKEFL